MNVAIIGTGISAIITAKTFLEYNCKVYIIDSENVYDKKKQFKEIKISFLPKNINKSPKFNNKYFTKSLKKYKKKYNIKTKNFFLATGLISGGLSNFWGAGIEIPKSNYLKKYSFGQSILKEKKFINKELKIDKNTYSFFDFFFKQQVILNMLKNKSKSIYFSKLLLAIKHYNKNKIDITHYNNQDLLSGINDHVYNAKYELLDMLDHKNLNYLPNTFVSNIQKKGKRYVLITDQNKILKIKFKKLIISAGTVGSTILVNKILKSKQKYRLFHTPILKLMYFSFSLPFKIQNRIKFSLPLLKLNFKIRKEKFCGSFMQLENISNNFFGISKLNVIFSILKKFFFIGNIFLPPNYSNTFMEVDKDKTLIYSNNNFNQKNLIKLIKKKTNSFFLNLNLFSFFLQNLKFMDNGADAHYTSTLINKFINGKKLLNKNCELNNYKNIHVIDGSTIKEGLYYPSYFLMLHARYISKQIIINEKKVKN